MPCDVSVVIPFGDDEERVGALARRVAAHLAQLGLAFEILAVDEGSGDNSVALLTILRAHVPELKLLSAGPRHGVAVAAAAARGRVLWILDGAQADVALAPFASAERRVASGEVDVVAFRRRFVVMRRTRTWRVLERARGRGDRLERQILRAALARRLRVELAPGGPPTSAWRRLVEHVL